MLGNRSLTTSRVTPNEFARQLFAPLASRSNLLIAMLSIGQDRRW
jgi:hypothetical protein